MLNRNTSQNYQQKIKVLKTLRTSFFEGTLSGISTSIFEHFIRPLALFINASIFQIGILSSLPQLMASGYPTAIQESQGLCLSFCSYPGLYDNSHCISAL